MKFNIIINQIVLAPTKLDIIDGAILDYLYYLCSSMSEKVDLHRKNGYTWVNFKHLIDEMPILRIKSKSRISERIKRIADEGYILTYREGNKFYIKLASKMDELFVKTNNLSPPFLKSNSSVIQAERLTPRSVPQTERNNSINNHNIKSNVNVGNKFEKIELSDTEQSRLEHHLDKIEDLENKRAWLDVIGQIGFQKTIEILIDVSESEDANNKGACAMGLAKKAGYKNFLDRTNSDLKQNI